MTTVFSYGAADSCELPLGVHTHLAPDAANHPIIHDPTAAIRAALAAPRDYPPLSAAVVPGDRVTIALGKGLVQLDALLRGVVAELTAAGVEPRDVTVLSAEPFADDPSPIADLGVRFVVHRPDDESNLAMIGMTAAGEPLRLNRALAEADVVIPIALARPAPDGDGMPAKFPGLFPQFASRETAERFHGRGAAAPAARRAQRAAEADEAGWKLGVQLSVAVVPGAGGGIAAVLAGEPTKVAAAGAEEFSAIWERPAENKGDLVIAAVSGGADQQTWSNLARAIAAAERVLGPEGAIAVCCELNEPPGGAFDRLVDAVDFAAVAKSLRGKPAADARSALILALALDRGPVYLRSRLPADVVESLGMTPVESDEELARLAGGRRHCVVIEEAQRVRPRWVGGGHGAE